MIRYEDINRIADFFDDSGYGGMDITMEIKVPNREYIRRLNEELYYRSGMDSDKGPSVCDEVALDCGGYNFVFKYAEN